MLHLFAISEISPPGSVHTSVSDSMYQVSWFTARDTRHVLSSLLQFTFRIISASVANYFVSHDIVFRVFRHDIRYSSCRVSHDRFVILRYDMSVNCTLGHVPSHKMAHTPMTREEMQPVMVHIVSDIAKKARNMEFRIEHKNPTISHADYGTMNYHTINLFRYSSLAPFLPLACVLWKFWKYHFRSFDVFAPCCVCLYAFYWHAFIAEGTVSLSSNNLCPTPPL